MLTILFYSTFLYNKNLGIERRQQDWKRRGAERLGISARSAAAIICGHHQVRQLWRESEFCKILNKRFARWRAICKFFAILRTLHGARPMITTDGNKRRRKTRLGKDARIAIIGSGLGGLGAALSLEQAGFTNVEIYERDASACCRREGYGLTLTYNPKGPLAQMGLLEQVAQCDCPSRSHYMFSVRNKDALSMHFLFVKLLTILYPF
jgi:hypothetical protein